MKLVRVKGSLTTLVLLRTAPCRATKALQSFMLHNGRNTSVEHVSFNCTLCPKVTDCRVFIHKIETYSIETGSCIRGEVRRGQGAGTAEVDPRWNKLGPAGINCYGRVRGQIGDNAHSFRGCFRE
jgi:hypothetical protein